MPDGSRRGPGLAVNVTLTFALVAAASIALNGFVSWRLHTLSLRAERANATRTRASLSAQALGDPGADVGALVGAAGVRAVATVDRKGAAVRRAGAPEEVDPQDTDLLATLRLGETRTRRVRSDSGSLLRVSAPIGPRSMPTGALVLWLDPPQDADARAHRLSVLYAVLNGALIAGFGWYLITRAVVRPIRRLGAATREVAEGNLDVRVRAEASGELRSLAQDFNRMTEALARKIGELEQANASLRAARAEVTQAEKLASLGRLASGVAHELGNPVAAVTGYVSMLLRDPPPGSEDILVRIEKEMRRVDRIIRDLLEYARPRMPIEERLDLDKLVDEAITVLQGQKAFGDAELVWTRVSVPAVLGDPHRLSQVLFNLLLNACDAVKSVPVKRIEVTVSEGVFPEMGERRRRSDDGAAPVGPAVVVRVSDSGTGLTAEQKEHLFEPFFTTKAKGTGLGLAISREIVEGLGGRIRVSGEPGNGAAFEVLLPRADAAPHRPTAVG